ncbi:DMT family transporter [bacterium]|nr:DMT family transporter [bacterium]
MNVDGWLARSPWLAPHLACLFFAAMAICARLLSALPTSEVMFFRCAIPVVIYLPMVIRDRSGLADAWSHRHGLFIRGLCGTLSLYFYLVALRSIPLADATVTSNTSPLWAALAAWLALGEAIPPRLRWAFPLSLVGVALVAGTNDASGPCSGYLAGLASAALSGSAYALIRKMRQLAPEIIALAFMGLAALCSLPFMLPRYQPPTLLQWKIIAAMGLTGAVGQWFMTVGYRHNSAATAASLGLASVAVTAALGYLILAEQLGPWQLVGMTMILLGTLTATR